MERLGYPDGAWTRPVLWSGSLLLMIADAAWLAPTTPWPMRVLQMTGLLVIGHYTTESWRKHRRRFPPLGRVEWPQQSA